MKQAIQNEFDFDCAQQHKLPICAIIQDPNLNVIDRLLCQQCIIDLDKDKSVLGWRKVQEKVQSHINEKQRINSQLISLILPLVKQVKSNIELLKDTIMKEFIILEGMIEEWQVRLQKEVKLLESQQFIKELEYVFGNLEIEVSLDETIKRDLKKINSNYISQVQSKLTFFNEFDQQKICNTVLNSIKKEEFQSQINKKIDVNSNGLDKKNKYYKKNNWHLKEVQEDELHFI
ncbi:unnamed protein product [Paramecium octaurelia]|uniref:Uncharacterized protein n=1 Tax=Paramecium octaurelia TaxID=43137 RepID=A0A8S1VVQ6_PAROT|nr:unnamed protein product [Paramecium octaurelia]